VTLIANYQPLQDAYGGPNYFAMDPNALYEIHVDNNGDAKEDLSFQFRFNNLARQRRGVTLPVGGKNGGHPADAGRPGDVAGRRPTLQCRRDLQRERGARRPPQRPGAAR
jgi:hypothetical protein